jgi:tetratricopeptide (TPR) repeat protein
MLTVVGGLSAQIPARSGLTQTRSNAPPMLVATPYTANEADSAVAVEAGHQFRERMTRSVVGRDFRVPPRTEMNRYLEEYGYAHDAILPFQPANELAQAMGQSRWIVFPTLFREQGGLYRFHARLIGTYPANNGAGYVVDVTQQAGQKLDDVAKAAADLFKPAIKALKESQLCLESQVSDPSKAREAAAKALKEVANFGLAEFCLGVLAENQDNTSSTALAHFQNALRTDPQALNSYYKIGAIYQLRSDSANAVATFQQMLRVEPLNDELREQAFTLFQRYNRASAAEEVADEGIRRDPNNPDWYDLKSNACLQQQKFACAVDELERLFAVDSTRADSLFFRKISIAGRYAIQEGGDTAQYVRWVKRAVERYPDDPLILQDAVRAYALDGDADNTILFAKKLLVIDPEDTEPITIAAAMLGELGQAERVIEFVPLAKSSGDERLQLALAGVLTGAAGRARASEDMAQQLLLAEAALETGTQDTRITGAAGFMIGEVLYPRITSMREQLLKSESCTEMTGYADLVDRALPAFEMALEHTDDRVKTFANQVLPFLRGEQNETLPSMRTAWKCGGGGN